MAGGAVASVAVPPAFCSIEAKAVGAAVVVVAAGRRGRRRVGASSDCSWATRNMATSKLITFWIGRSAADLSP